jgi:hypothetical protein
MHHPPAAAEAYSPLCSLESTVPRSIGLSMTSARPGSGAFLSVERTAAAAVE